MNCPRCNMPVQNNSNFCTNCGENLNNNHNNQYNYSYNYSNKTDPNYNMNTNHLDQYNYSNNYSYNNYYTNSSDDIYLKAYVGENYEKIKNTRFSLPTFFLGAYYLLYRKLWLCGILYIIINFFATIYIDTDYGVIISLALNLFFSFKFASLYLAKANNSIDKIKQQSLDKTNQEILALCRKKGGTSIAAPIIMGLILTFMFFIILFAALTDEITNELKNNYHEQFTNEMYDLSYELPSQVISIYNSEDYQKLIYNNDDLTTCKYYISANDHLTTYKTEELYLSSSLFITEDDQEKLQIIPVVINETPWKCLTIEHSEDSQTECAVIYNEKLYSIKTIQYKYNGRKNPMCTTKYNELLNSAQLKKTNNVL